MNAPTLDLESLRKELAAAKPPEKTLSVRKTLFALMPEILKKRENMTLDELVDWFQDRGIKTTRSALCNYIQEHLKKHPPEPELPGPAVPAAAEKPLSEEAPGAAGAAAKPDASRGFSRPGPPGKRTRGSHIKTLPPGQL